MAGTKRSTLSTLESLPIELIQHIFFHSFEVNMPRASPYLAQVLSKPSIYTALVLFAYFDDDDQSPVETLHFRPAEYRRIALADHVRLQQGILACRWCTLDLLKSCMPVLSRLQMVQAWHREHDAEQSLMIDPGSIPQVTNDVLRPVAALPALDDHVAMEKHFLAKLETAPTGDLGLSVRSGTLGPVGEDKTLPRIMQWRSSVDEQGQPHKTIQEGISVLAARVIPDQALRGSPWTNARITLVQLLRQGMRFLGSEHVVSVSAKALFEGMSGAIRERNETALLVLLELHHAVMRLDAEDNAGDDVWGRSTPRGRCLVGPFTHPLPLELFHLACGQQERERRQMAEAEPEIGTDTNTKEESESRTGKGTSAQLQSPIESQFQSQSQSQSQSQARGTTARILSLLIREGLDSIPPDDGVLTRWAIHTVRAPSPTPFETSLARWLLDHMSGVYDHGHGLFVNGMPSPRMREAIHALPSPSPFPERSFTDEIGYV